MAKNTQHYEPVITLNSKAAENALEGLKVKANQVRAAIHEAGKIGDEKKLKELDRELRSIEGSQRKLRKETFDYNNVLKSLNTSSIKDLERTSKALRKEISLLSPGTQEFIQKSRQLDIVRGRIDQLNVRVRETHSWFTRAGSSISKYFGMATAAIASVTGLSFAVRGSSEQAAKMDDIYSDVMKTTGLLRKEVVWLNDEFKKLNTRTSREELNGLARDAGKLGISGRDNVLEFVRAANQINVALREDLGDDAIRNIGKLAEVFKITKDLGVEKSFLSIGSAINALGQASTAQEQYLVDFTQRIAGVAYQSGMSIQNVLGFASALDQTGQKVEMSATAFQKFLMKMFSDTTTFAKMANMEVSAFSELLRKDVNEAVLTVLTALNDKGGFAALVPIFQDMGLDGARAVSVLSAMATNVNLVREAQALSNKEFLLATDLTREYNVKNENMQAGLEKAKKAFKDQVIILGERLYPAYVKSTNSAALFLKFLANINKEFVYAALIFGAAIIAAKSWNAVVAIGNTIMTSARLISLGWASGMALLQGNTIRAAAAWKMFNAAFSATAIGAIVTAVTALGYGLYKLITYQSDLTKATKEYYAESQKTKREAADLLTVLEQSVVGSDNYKTALEKLVELYGPYISHLIDEKGNLTDIKLARDAINTSIEQSIGLKIKEATISKITEKSLNDQADYYEEMVRTLMKHGKVSEDVARMYATEFTNSIAQGKEWGSVVNDFARRLNKYFEIRPFRQFANEYNKMLSDIAAAENKFSFITPKSQTTPSGETEAQRKARLAKEKAESEQALAEEKERLKKLAEEKAKLREELFKKELDALDRQEREKEVLLKKQYIDKELTSEEYEAKLTANTISFLTQRNALYIKYNKDNTNIESSYYDVLIKLADNSLKQIEKINKDINDRLKKMISERKEEVESLSKEDRLFWDRYNQLLKDADNIKNDYSERSWKKRKEKEVARLDEMLKLQMITHEEYEYSLKRFKIKNAEDIARSVNAIMQSMSDFYIQIQEYQYFKLEREKERELALYGNSADSRAEIEQKYEKKKLELQQKYADMEMIIKIAQTVAAGALGEIQAIAQLGPIAGLIAAGFVRLTTAMSIATIVSQRNAIKKGMVSSENNSASRTVNEYADGGFTERDRSDRKPVGVVHANEWVAPAAMVRANPLVFASLERQRVNKYSIMSPVKQFASGGFTTTQKSDNTDIILALHALSAEIKALKDKPWKGYVVVSEFTATQDVMARIKQEGSL